MAGITKIKENWDGNVPVFQNKVSNMLSSGDEEVSKTLNPFLNKNGSIVNPYINYQKVLDNPNVSSNAKNYIQQAIGLSPVVTASQATGTSNGSIVSAAKNYIGTPYVWGGESMSEGGMDCSGFIYNALKDAGYDVGRTTAQGYRSYGNSISKSDIQPGDLIFFGKDNNASHVGIYIGNGQMIHSAGGSKNTKSNPGKGVSVVNINHRSDFLEARRV